MYKAIEELNENYGYSISWLCRRLKVTRAAYYKWKNRKPSENDVFNGMLLEMIKEIYDSRNGAVGSYEINQVLNRRLGMKINHKKIERIMCINGIRSRFRAKRKYNFKRSTPEEIAENILNRNFQPTMPDQVWLTDITEIKAKDGKVYVCTIIDPYCNYPIAQMTSTRNDCHLVNSTVEMAHEKYPDASPIFHSDRGFQFTRSVFSTMIKRFGFTQSMSRVSKCIDNGPMECFQGVMKDQMAIMFPCVTVEEIMKKLPEYMEYYTKERPQRRLDGQTPEEARRAALEAEKPMVYPTLINYHVKHYWEEINAHKA